MTKFEEELRRPDNTGIEPFSKRDVDFSKLAAKFTRAAQTLKKWREYAGFKEKQLEKKDEEIQELRKHCEKLENKNSFMRDERTTFDSNGDSVEPIIPQQALPVVPEDVAKLPPFDEMKEYVLDERLLTIREYLNKLDDKSNSDITEAEAWCMIHEDIAYRAMLDGYTVEKQQLFKLIFPNSTAVLQKDGELNSFADTVYKRYLMENAMTEQEIKSIDERYWQFAVPVEEE